MLLTKPHRSSEQSGQSALILTRTYCGPHVRRRLAPSIALTTVRHRITTTCVTKAGYAKKTEKGASSGPVPAMPTLPVGDYR